MAAPALAHPPLHIEHGGPEPTSRRDERPTRDTLASWPLDPIRGDGDDYIYTVADDDLGIRIVATCDGRVLNTNTVRTLATRAEEARYSLPLLPEDAEETRRARSHFAEVWDCPLEAIELRGHLGALTGHPEGYKIVAAQLLYQRADGLTPKLEEALSWPVLDRDHALYRTIVDHDERRRPRELGRIFAIHADVQALDPGEKRGHCLFEQRAGKEGCWTLIPGWEGAFLVVRVGDAPIRNAHNKQHKRRKHLQALLHLSDLAGDPCAMPIEDFVAMVRRMEGGGLVSKRAADAFVWNAVYGQLSDGQVEASPEWQAVLPAVRAGMDACARKAGVADYEELDRLTDTEFRNERLMKAYCQAEDVRSNAFMDVYDALAAQILRALGQTEMAETWEASGGDLTEWQTVRDLVHLGWCL